MTNLIKKYVNISDRKRTVSLNEFNTILEELKKVTTIHSIITTTGGSYVQKMYFYRVDITKFPTYPQFIGEVHNKYGRNIEIYTYCDNHETLYLYFRGNNKEVQKFKNKQSKIN